MVILNSDELYSSYMVLDTYGHKLYSSYKVLDTYGDFEQTVMNYITVIRYWVPMVILNSHELYSSFKILDTYGDFEQTVMNYYTDIPWYSYCGIMVL